jgi:hypothetical protein
MTTDEEAEALLDTDLSDLDFSQFKPVRLRFTNKTAAKEHRRRGAPTGASSHSAAATNSLHSKGRK